VVQELPRRTLIVRLSVTAALALTFALGACRGEARPTNEEAALTRTIDSLVPSVERTVGLNFKRHPKARMVDRAEAAAFIQRNLATQMGGGRAQHLASAYRLLGLLPDTLDLARLLGNVLAEQVAGYYDPKTGTFYGVREAGKVGYVLTVSHELVHALQDDYLPLDSIQDATGDADRLLAAQAMLEGQATLAMMRMNPEIGDRALAPEFWEQIRDGLKGQQQQMPQLTAAPRLVREALTFPYFSGAEYMRWWVTTHPADRQPYGADMPRSSEQILAPERVARGDVPLTVTFVRAPVASYSDGLGAAETRLLLAEARGQEELIDPAVLGWGGDRFELYDTPAGDALVWIAVFDSSPARDGALRALAAWPGARSGYRRQLDPLDVSGRSALRLTVAPTSWGQWSALPTATAGPGS
jgi:hypothetical protein